MRNFVDNFSILIIFFLTFISCNSKYTDIEKEVILTFNQYDYCIKKEQSNIEFNSIICLNKISDNFEILGTFDFKNSIEYLIKKENVTSFLVNSEIHQSIIIKKNSNKVFNVENIPMFDNNGNLNNSFFELDAFQVIKVKKLSDNFYFIVKEYKAD